MQAWGLFESKYGDLRRSRMLLRRAVQLDGTFNNPLPFIPQWSDELCGDGRHCKVGGGGGSDDAS